MIGGSIFKYSFSIIYMLGLPIWVFYLESTNLHYTYMARKRWFENESILLCPCIVSDRNILPRRASNYNVVAGCLWASPSAQEADCGEWFASEATELNRGKKRWTKLGRPSVGQTDGYFLTQSSSHQHRIVNLYY